MTSECSSDQFNSCLSNSQSSNSSTTCCGQLERGEKGKLDLHEWMKLAFLDNADEEEIQRYVRLFMREGINSSKLLALLTNEDMKKLKIKLGHRRLLLKAIASFPINSSDSNELDTGRDLLENTGRCSRSVFECKDRVRKTVRKSRRKTYNYNEQLQYNLRTDNPVQRHDEQLMELESFMSRRKKFLYNLRADNPVQRNDMQQMKLESFMSRVTRSYPGSEVVNEISIKCSICLEVIKLGSFFGMSNYHRHHSRRHTVSCNTGPKICSLSSGVQTIPTPLSPQTARITRHLRSRSALKGTKTN